MAKLETQFELVVKTGKLDELIDHLGKVINELKLVDQHLSAMSQIILTGLEVKNVTNEKAEPPAATDGPSGKTD